MKQFFPAKRELRSLSIRDLLEAREAYHLHLAHLENVVATAIGYYRIRRDDPDAQAPQPLPERRSLLASPPRQLQDTVVRPWTWT